jgi:hypothetical protein
MEKRMHSQLELFAQPKTSFDLPGSQNSFLARVQHHEKTVLLIVGFIVTGVISFSLGVEKGKGISAARAAVNFDIAQNQKIQIPVVKPAIKPPQTPPPRRILESKLQPIVVADKIKPAVIVQKSYTIQVASYQTNRSAKRETESLKKAGLTPLTLPKGKYIIVCVGNFADMQLAKPILTQLKRRYRDCFVRRL